MISENKGTQVTFFRKGMRIYIPLIITAALLFYCFRTLELDKFLLFFKSISSLGFCLIILVLSVNILVVTFRLDRLLKHFGYPIEFSDTLKASINGFFSSLFIFSFIGSILGRQFFLQRKNVPLSACTLISTYERAVIFIISLFLFLIGAVILLDSNVILKFINQIPLWQMLATLILIIGTLQLLTKSPFEEQLWRNLRSLKTLLRIGEISIISISAQFLVLFAYVIAVYQIAPNASILAVLSAAAVVSFAASLPISINGWGVREVAASVAFQQIGLTESESIAISAFIGVCSTAVILIFSAFLLRKKTHQGSMDRVNKDTIPSTPAEQTFFSVISTDNSDRTLAIVLPSIATVLVFFQFHTQFGSGTVTVNIADAFALLGICIVPILYFLSGPKTIAMSRIVVVWLSAMTTLFVLSFLWGLSNFGLIDWALQNRLIGWFVLMGYFCIGAMLIGKWGAHGLRRMAELIVVSAAIITIFNLLLVFMERIIGLPILFESNFEGFSANRNTFAFQLTLALVCAFVYSDRRGNGRSSMLWTALTSCILYGVWQAQSKAGIGVSITLIALCIITGIGSSRKIMQSLAFAIGAYVIIRVVGLILSPTPELLHQAVALAPNIESINPATYLDRIESTVVAFKLWSEHILLGTGLGGFIYYTQITANTNVSFLIHSTPLWILVEFGLVGFLIMASLPAYGLYLIIKGKVGTRNAPVCILIGICLCLFLFGLVHEISFQRLFWLLLGASTGTLSLQKARNLLKQKLITRSHPPIIIHIINSLNQGGAESMLLALSKQQRATMKPIIISLMKEGALSDRVRSLGIECHHLNFKPRHPDFVGMYRLIRLIQNRKPAVVQGWMYHGDLASFIALYLSGLRKETMLIWGIRCSDMDLSRYSRSLRLIVRACIFSSRFPDHIIANSNAGAAVHKKLGYRADKMDVILNGIETDIFYPRPEMRIPIRESLGLPLDGRVLFHVARVDPMKNHLGLLRAVADTPNVWLVMIGRGTDNLPNQDRVLALGQRSDVRDLLQAGDGIISSSLYGEGFSNAVSEGMACGLVPLATDTGDSCLILGDVGWSFPPNDPDALKASINAFLELTDAELQRLKNAACERIRDNFGLPVMAKAYRELYNLPRSDIRESSLSTKFVVKAS